MHRGRIRSLVIVATVLLAVVIAVFVSGSLSAPESDNKTTYTDGQPIHLKGEAVCLPHKDQSGPQTLECAIGFKDEAGNYYHLKDTTPEHSFVSDIRMGEPIEIEGTYRTAGDSKYQMVGSIELKAIVD